MLGEGGSAHGRSFGHRLDSVIGARGIEDHVNDPTQALVLKRDKPWQSVFAPAWETPKKMNEALRHEGARHCIAARDRVGLLR